MSDSRELVLGRIRRALGESGGTRVEIPRGYRTAGARPRAEVLDLFVERVSDYDATVLRVSPQELPGTLAKRLTGRGARRIAIPSDLPGEWLERVPSDTVEWLVDAADGERGPGPTADDPDPVPGSDILSKGRLASVHGVITGCALAIAETGTIVLDGGEAQGRRALSLLPDYHLCVVLADQVVESVPEGVARMGAAVAERGAPLTLVSGPSATSDIELERVQGVHGPRTLDVILVEAEE